MDAEIHVLVKKYFNIFNTLLCTINLAKAKAVLKNRWREGPSVHPTTGQKGYNSYIQRTMWGGRLTDSLEKRRHPWLKSSQHPLSKSCILYRLWDSEQDFSRLASVFTRENYTTLENLFAQMQKSSCPCWSPNNWYRDGDCGHVGVSKIKLENNNLFSLSARGWRPKPWRATWRHRT